MNKSLPSQPEPPLRKDDHWPPTQPPDDSPAYYRRSPPPPKDYSLLSTIWLLFLAAFFGLAITALAFRSYAVDGASMENTLQNNDRVIIDKIPRTLARATHHPYIPHRGDIIIFSQFGFFDNSGPATKQLIKRVVGLPSERVVIKDGRLRIYNSQQTGGFEPDHSGFYRIDSQSTPGNVDLVVPAGSVFVCGDNRANSTDSRFFGPVSSAQIVGKLVLRFWPLDQSKGF